MMKENKICFISCVNDQQLYNEALYYIDHLEVPKGYEIECISIENANSITAGYNAAMKASDAKYKVYLHQDVYIINKSFIEDTLNIFNSDDKIGMLGVVGAKVIPTNAIWWESKKKYGKVYDSHTGQMDLLSFDEVLGTYETVQAIDGLIMITQYDRPWREDIFDGWHFYDLSQSIEFIKSGYEVAITKQESPWVIHDCGIVNVKNGYEDYRKLLLQEYSKDIFSLVSILIPAYNQTKYLKEALESAINQTYPNIEIIIGDDSTTSEVEDFIKPYLDRYHNIIYFRNDRMEMDYGYKNHVELFIRSKGEYINYLNHDDIFHPKKIEAMMRYFIENPSVALVTSARQTIDENGNDLSLNGIFTPLFTEDTILGGQDICKHATKNMTNFIGEPTTALFKRKYIKEGEYGYFNGIRFWGIADLANWFTILQNGSLVYIAEKLSCFRVHREQSTNMPKVFIKGTIAWIDMIRSCYEKGILTIDEYKLTLNNWFKLLAPSLNDYLIKNDAIDKELKNEILDTYKNIIAAMLEEVTYNHQCVICAKKVHRFLPYTLKIPESMDKFNIVGSDINNFSCPYCYSHDRERHLKIYFDKLGLWSNIPGNKVLHIAPEMNFKNIVKSYSPNEYICGDLYPVSSEIMRIDITKIDFQNEYFDLIICNHVLEHIEDDKKAIHELYRVLKKGGYAVLQTPYSPVIENSFEDFSIQTKEQRLQNYGQEDHVRIYGLDFFKRLESAGFKLAIITNSELFSREECKKYGVNFDEDLILVYK